MWTSCRIHMTLHSATRSAPSTQVAYLSSCMWSLNLHMAYWFCKWLRSVKPFFPIHIISYVIFFCRSNPNKPNEAILVFGDVLGQVNALLFSAANVALFDRPSQPAGNKQGVGILHQWFLLFEKIQVFSIFFFWICEGHVYQRHRFSWYPTDLPFF